jgi:hypothetical protein
MPAIQIPRPEHAGARRTVLLPFSAQFLFYVQSVSKADRAANPRLAEAGESLDNCYIMSVDLINY